MFKYQQRMNEGNITKVRVHSHKSSLVTDLNMKKQNKKKDVTLSNLYLL